MTMGLIAPAAVVALGYCAVGHQRSTSTWSGAKKAVDGAAALSHNVTLMIMVVATLCTEFRTPRGAVSRVAQVA